MAPQVGSETLSTTSSSVRWLAAAAVTAGAAWLAAAEGRAMFAWILAFGAIMSLYGALDHNADTAAGELLGPASPVAPAGTPEPQADHDEDDALTARQRRVLRFLAYGLPDDEIAELLAVDEPAVRGDVDRIVALLGAGDRAEAVHLAQHSGALVGTRQPRARSAA